MRGNLLRPGLKGVAIAAVAVPMIAGTAATNASAATASKPVSGGTLSIEGVEGSAYPDLSWGNPGYQIASDSENSMTQGALFLTPTKPGGPVVPDLATSYKYNPDNTQLTINLRHGVKFQDGTPFNAAAVKWLWSPAFDENPTNIAYQYFPDVKSVATKGQYTVIVNFKQPNATFVGDLANDVVGLVASPTAFRKEGANGFNLHPVGAGPYEVTKHVPFNSLVLTKWNGYWDAKHVYIKTITEPVTGTDPTTLIDDLKTGVIANLGVSANTLSPDQVKAALADTHFTHSISKQTTPVFVIEANRAPFWSAGPNAAKGQMAREALAYCTNREAITQDVLGGYAEPEYVWAGPSSIEDFYPEGANGKPSVAAAKKLDPFQYDPSKAKAIVKKLGGLSFTLDAAQNLIASVPTALSQEWAQCGIQAKVNILQEQNELVTLGNGDYTAFATISGGVADPRLWAKFIVPGQRFDSAGQVNIPAVNKAWNDSQATTSQKQVQKDWTTIFRALNAKAMDLPVAAIPTYTVENKCLHGVSVFGTGLSYTHAWLSCDLKSSAG